jgi:hypothetical protein
MNHTYHSEVEAHIQAARDQPGYIMSALDFGIVDNWYECGIPLDVVLRGVDLSVESFRKAHRGDPVRVTPKYCNAAIINLARRAQARQPVHTQSDTSASPSRMIECRSCKKEFDKFGDDVGDLGQIEDCGPRCLRCVVLENPMRYTREIRKRFGVAEQTTGGVK